MAGRLKLRRDFLAVAKGQKAVRRAFMLESRRRGDQDPPRFGFTISKRVAKSAVERNRIRRRLKEAARLEESRARPGHDYVLVGRRAALTEPFAALRAELAAALTQEPAAGRRTKSGGTAAREERP